MPYNENLAIRTRELIAATHHDVEEKHMFGGVCFMVNGKMCVGILKDTLMVRLDPAVYADVLENPGCRPMDFNGRDMKGFVFVDDDVLHTHKQLNYWVQLALNYNPMARKAAKKVKKTGAR